MSQRLSDSCCFGSRKAFWQLVQARFWLVEHQLNNNDGNVVIVINRWRHFDVLASHCLGIS
jgi:hypothetical protein